MQKPQTGYSAASITIHWLTAFFIVALFLTGEGNREIVKIHIAAGAIVGIFLVWRVLRRSLKGMAEKPDQHRFLYTLSKFTIWGMMIAIIIATLTGYFLPWTRGSAINIFDIVSIPSPMALNPALHEMVEALHDLSGHAFIPLVGLHTIGAIKHHFIDKDTVLKRIFSPVKSGK